MSKEIPSYWTGDAKNVETANEVVQSRYGMLAAIPMICKAQRCPFFKACHIPKDQLQEGARCPIEVATILDRFERYSKHLEVADDNIVDLSLVRELCDIDIQLTRAEMKLAIDADFVEEVIATVDQHGQPWYKPELNKAVDYKDRLRKERHRILDLLASTRKNKDTSKGINDPSTIAALLMARAREATKTEEKGE